MKILLYGSKGWIGSQVIILLEKRGHEVILGQSRVDNKEYVEQEIINYGPSHVMSFIGRTHGKIGDKVFSTIDYLEEPGKIKENVKDQFGILITDGNYNRGDDPVILAKKYPKLHVIGMPAENDADRGIDTCRELAKVGHGKFFAVNNYKEIPRALIELLSKT